MKAYKEWEPVFMGILCNMKSDASRKLAGARVDHPQPQPMTRHHHLKHVYSSYLDWTTQVILRTNIGDRID